MMSLMHHSAGRQSEKSMCIIQRFCSHHSLSIILSDVLFFCSRDGVMMLHRCHRSPQNVDVALDSGNDATELKHGFDLVGTITF